jgi:hypothetical protein
MLTMDKTMEANGMTNVLGILVQLCGKEDASISDPQRKKDNFVPRKLPYSDAEYSLVKMSPCTRVRVYTVNEASATKTQPPGKKKRIEDFGKLHLTEPEPKPVTLPLFVHVIGLAAFKTLVSNESPREILMSALNLRASPSQTGQQMRINERRYLKKTLYGIQFEKAIPASIPYSHGEKKQQYPVAFHEARELTDDEKREFMDFQRKLRT